VFVLDKQNSIGNQYLSELRDVNHQRDRLRFRTNVERLGQLMAYEVSKALSYEQKQVVTPLGEKPVHILKEQPVLITILRAGLPFFQGFLSVFDKADAGFIGAYRKEGEHITIKLDYVATTSIKDRVVILIDPMLATGRSILDSVNAILPNGTPSHIHIVSLLAAEEGIKYLTTNLKLPFTLWACSVDKELNQQFYIVPGLGDAGDLSYGSKI
jgi:uracil phosphoribosyltransferase